ncbi:MAG: hypothetical protein L0027_09880, partial [Candidatus Rokubacteria bacterium]|nr:hypothetical protein [Candidatus Rokubacteria bacterium]
GFRPLPPPADAEVERVARRVARGLARLLERGGLGPAADPSEADPLPGEQPLLAALYAASVAGRAATGPRAEGASCDSAIASTPTISPSSRESAARPWAA